MMRTARRHTKYSFAAHKGRGVASEEARPAPRFAPTPAERACATPSYPYGNPAGDAIETIPEAAPAGMLPAGEAKLPPAAARNRGLTGYLMRTARLRAPQAGNERRRNGGAKAGG